MFIIPTSFKNGSENNQKPGISEGSDLRHPGNTILYVPYSKHFRPFLKNKLTLHFTNKPI